MAIKNSLSIKGLSVPEAYSRIGAVNVDSRGPQLRVTLTVEDYANEAAAAKVFEDVTRVEAPEYDPDNEEHLRQWRANGGLDEDGKDLSVDPTWRPTIYVTEQKWLGKRVQTSLQERSLELPLDLALQLIARAVPGTPEGLSARLIAEAYLVALATGVFADAESI